MARRPVSFGLTRPNRGVMFGATTRAQMLELAEMAESAGCFASVWVGDSVMWIAHGSVQQCADHINQFIDAGVERFTLRLTSWDQRGQFRRVVDDLMPRLKR